MIMQIIKKVLANMKNIFKKINIDNANFKENEKCLLNTKFKIKKNLKILKKEYQYMIKSKIKIPIKN